MPLYKTPLSLFFICIAFFATAQKSNVPNTFMLDAKMLAQSKARISKGDSTLMPAYKELMKAADKALNAKPFSVTNKKDAAPSTDIHDYVSIAPYWFPDSTKPNGLPYIRRDGIRNPEVRNYSDKDALPKMADAVSKLSLAYYFSGDEKYASKATSIIRIFFLDSATRMNPNMNYAQAVKGRNNGRGAGIIESRHLVSVVDGINLIQQSQSWTATDQQEVEKWFTHMLNWMQTSKNGKEENFAKNNHGVFYDMQRMCYALLTKNIALQNEVIEKVKFRIDNQQAADGSFPAELQRTIGLHYSTFILKAFYSIAYMAERVNVDLWNYTSPNGKSLKTATEFWFPYATQQQQWKWQQIKPYECDHECVDILKIATIKYHDPKYADYVSKVVDTNIAKKHLSNLVAGLDLR